MSKSNATQRIGQLKLDLLKEKETVVTFDGEDVTGNSGVLLLAQAEKMTGLLSGAEKRLQDHRTASLIKHNQFEMIAQRVHQIAVGLPAADDSDKAKGDAAIKVGSGRHPLLGEDLSSQPTQSRFEGGRSYKELYRLSEWLVDYYIQCHPKPPRHLVLDFDGSAMETFGIQLQAFYRSGPYKKFMYFPLFVFDEAGWLLVAALRPGDDGEVKLALPVLKRLVGRLRKAWPAVRITVRADGAFTDAALYRWLDENGVDYVLGLKHNNVLLSRSWQFREAAKKCFKRKHTQPKFTGSKGKQRKLKKLKAVRSIADRKERREAHEEMNSRRVRVFGDFQYGAKTWDRERRIVCRCDFDDSGLNVRYVVTSFKNHTASQVYEIYCRRAKIELWIKNLKETRCARLSCAQFKSNMFRLLLHALAYLLIHQVRCVLPKHFQSMSIEKFRRLFLNVAAHVHEGPHTAVFRLSASYSEAHTFRPASKRLGAQSLIAA